MAIETVCRCNPEMDLAGPSLAVACQCTGNARPYAQCTDIQMVGDRRREDYHFVDVVVSLSSCIIAAGDGTRSGPVLG